MEELISFIFIGLIIELLFWGVCYTTGKIIIYIVSIGKWKAKPRLKNKQSTNKNDTEVKSSNELYIDALGVCLIGICFWVIVIVVYAWI